MTAARREFLRRAGAAATGALALGLAPIVAGAVPSREPTRVRVYSHDDCMLHLAGSDHPEHPRRLEAIRTALAGHRVEVVMPRPAELVDLSACHSAAYLRLVESEVRAGRATLSTGDTALSAGSLAAALAAAGSVTAAVDAVLAGTTATAFCATRPPGHHASRERGMGFCIFNNVAIGAHHARMRHGVARVLIVDWDVHHGNGTQEIFWSDGSVLFFDTHRDNWYPGTGHASERGEGKGAGLIINRPFPKGAGRREILGAFRDTLMPAAERFRPELVMVSAGFDSRIGDPLGGFTLTDSDFADLTNVVREIAARHAGGRIVSVLEGGYRPDGLASAVLAHIGRLGA